MKTNLRGLLATMFATGLLAACSSEGNTPTPVTDAGTVTDMGVSATDVPRTDAAATDRPAVAVDRPPAGNPVTAACSAATDLSSMTPGADGAIHVMGDNSEGAPITVGNIGTIPEGGCLNAQMGEKGMVLIYRYTMRTAGTLRVSTANAGTSDAAFDTVVAVLGTCTATAMPLACNDDLGTAAGMTHRYHSTASTRALMMGQTVFIVVGGYGASAKEGSTGAFELTVAEAAPIAIGMPCAVAQVCATGSACVGATAMNSGTCAADGTAPGAVCRAAAPFCDGTFTCSVAMPSMAARGICRRPAAPGEACGPTASCTMMSFCPNFASTAPVAADAGVGTDAGAPMTARYCTLPTAEIEPNNTPAAPQAAVTTTTVFRGSLATGNDVDCYAVTVPVGTSLYAETSDANGTCALGDGEDTLLNIYRQGETAALANNDDVAMGYLCSRIVGTTAVTRIPAGTYSICVSAYGAGTDGGAPVAIPSYYLTVGITP